MTTRLQPIILIGAGRSGTKFVRDCLNASPEVARVPYDVSYVWRTGNDACPHDELTRADAKHAPKDAIRRTLERMARSEGKHAARFMVEKSVPNALRPGFVDAVMPDARFIHLVRDGRAVTESSMRMWQAPRETGHILRKLRYFPLTNYRYAFWYAGDLLRSKLSREAKPPMWGPRYDGMEKDIADALPLGVICARQWRICVERSLAQLAELSPERVHQIRYEDLASNAERMAELAAFVGIPDPSVVVKRFRTSLERDNVAKWRDKMSAADAVLVEHELGGVLGKLGYS
ncbi:MAG: sulfotransferase [Hyphomicrobiaceae bacterium]